MKFGPKFNKMFVQYPSIDRSKITHNRLHDLTRNEMYEILRGMKKDGKHIPFAQPTRTKSAFILAFIYHEMDF